MDNELINTQNSLRKAMGTVNDYKNLYEIFQTRVAEMQYSVKSLGDYQTKIISNTTIDLAQFLREQSNVINGYEKLITKTLQSTLDNLVQPIKQLNDDLKPLRESAQVVSKVFKNYDLLYFPQNEIEEDDIEEKEANTKIVNEIFNPDSEEFTNNKESTIITLSPVNEQVLKYLSENPQALYQLTGTDFEMVMLEIYSKLGYNVEHTQKTRDGGKDIILRKPEILGDFIYYVECKKYAAKRHVGVGIVRNLVGTINTDRVNGGILATTSYFTLDARKFILENNYGYQIQMHDYDIIRRLLDNAIK